MKPEEDMLLPSGAAMFRMDERERIYELTFGHEENVQQNMPVSLGIFIIRKSLLESLVADSIAFGRYDFYRDIIQRLSGNLNILGYEHRKIYFEISTVSGYMKENMRLLSADVRNQIFEKPV